MMKKWLRSSAVPIRHFQSEHIFSEWNGTWLRYAANSRMIDIQSKMTERAIELMMLSDDEPSLVSIVRLTFS